MAKSVQELEEIVMRLNRDLIAWQKWAQEFRNWTINELNRMKAGRPTAVTPNHDVQMRRGVRDAQMEMLMGQLQSMGNDLDCISADLG